MDTASTPMNEQQSARGQLIVTSRRSQTQHTDTIPRSSRSSSHNSGIQNFEAKLQNTIDDTWPARSPPRSPSDVHVLLLLWEEDEDNVRCEVEDLENVFRKRYKFATQTWQIPLQNSHLKLMEKALIFASQRSGEGALFIIYYGGHASVTQSRGSRWLCNRSSKSPSVHWSAIQTVFEEVSADVLLLLDCCFAASAASEPGQGGLEVIAACGFESVTPSPGPWSFTNRLTQVLKEWAGRLFSTAMLHCEVLMRLKLVRPRQISRTNKLEARTPIFIVTHSDPNRSLIIFPRSSTYSEHASIQSSHSQLRPNPLVPRLGTKETTRLQAQRKVAASSVDKFAMKWARESSTISIKEHKQCSAKRNYVASGKITISGQYPKKTTVKQYTLFAIVSLESRWIHFRPIPLSVLYAEYYKIWRRVISLGEACGKTDFSRSVGRCGLWESVGPLQRRTISINLKRRSQTKGLWSSSALQVSWRCTNDMFPIMEKDGSEEDFQWDFGMTDDESVDSAPSMCHKFDAIGSYVYPRLRPFKDYLTESLMNEYYQIFGLEASEPLRCCPTDQYSGASNLGCHLGQSFSLETCNQGHQKRNRLDRDDDANEDGEGDQPERKKPKDNSKDLRMGAYKRRYACIYNKHNPAFFRNSAGSKFAACDGQGFDDIAHLKEHLFRAHYQQLKCTRCKIVLHRSDYRAHVEGQICQSRAEHQTPHEEGFSHTFAVYLREKKKSAGEEGVRRWREIYAEMFPNEPIPSPYVGENSSESTASISNNQLSRAEQQPDSSAGLTRAVRARFNDQVNAAVDRVLVPIAQGLLGQAANTIRDTQDEIYQEAQRHRPPRSIHNSISATSHTPRLEVSHPSSPLYNNNSTSAISLSSQIQGQPGTAEVRQFHQQNEPRNGSASTLHPHHQSAPPVSDSGFGPSCSSPFNPDPFRQSINTPSIAARDTQADPPDQSYIDKIVKSQVERAVSPLANNIAQLQATIQQFMQASTSRLGNNDNQRFGNAHTANYGISSNSQPTQYSESSDQPPAMPQHDCTSNQVALQSSRSLNFNPNTQTMTGGNYIGSTNSRTQEFGHFGDQFGDELADYSPLFDSTYIPTTEDSQ